MEYIELVRDFAKRTQKNLELVRTAHKQGNEQAYEVTQLINSLLGLLVFPQQKYIREIPQTPMQVLIDDGWPVPKIIDNYPQASDLQQLVRYLRNGVSHFNIKFIARHGTINGIIIWNYDRNKIITWKAELSLIELEGFANKFIDLILSKP